MNSNRFGALRLCTDLLENRLRIDMLLREYRPLIVELADVDLEPTSVGERQARAGVFSARYSGERGAR